MLRKIFIFQILTGMIFSLTLINHTGCGAPPPMDKEKRANYVPIPIKYSDVHIFQVIKKENSTGYTFENSKKETLNGYLDGQPVFDKDGNKKIYTILDKLEAGNTLEHFINLEKEYKDQEDIYHIYWGIDSRIGKRINKNYDIIVLVQHEHAFALYRFKLDDEGEIMKDDNDQLIYDDTPGQKFTYNSLVVFDRKYILTLSK